MFYFTTRAQYAKMFCSIVIERALLLV